MWHVSSRSGVAPCELLRTCYLLTYLTKRGMHFRDDILWTHLVFVLRAERNQLHAAVASPFGDAGGRYHYCSNFFLLAEHVDIVRVTVGDMP